MYVKLMIEQHFTSVLKTNKRIIKCPNINKLKKLKIYIYMENVYHTFHKFIIILKNRKCSKL